MGEVPTFQVLRGVQVAHVQSGATFLLPSSLLASLSAHSLFESRKLARPRDRARSCSDQFIVRDLSYTLT